MGPSCSIQLTRKRRLSVSRSITIKEQKYVFLHHLSPQNLYYICLSLFISALSGLRSSSIINSMIVRSAALFVINCVLSEARAKPFQLEGEWKFECSQISAYFCVPILIQTRVTVTQYTLLYHLYIMLVRKKQKEIEDYIFSIDPKNVVTYQHRASEISFICTLLLLSVPP